MSISYLAMAMRTHLPRAQKLVLLCLAESCNDWGFCTPGHKHLSFKCCISVRTVVRTLQELVDAGLLIAKKTPGKPTLYQIRGAETDIPGITKTSTIAKPEVEISVEGPKQSAAPVIITDQCQNVTSDKMALVTKLHQCQNVTSDKMALPLKRKKGLYTEDFIRFWNVYPRGEGKSYAFQVWAKLKLTPAEVQEVIEHVEKRKQLDRQWVENEGRFIPHASTFLNRRSWEDTYQTNKTQSKPDQPKYRNLSDGPAPWEM